MLSSPPTKALTTVNFTTNNLSPNNFTSWNHPTSHFTIQKITRVDSSSEEYLDFAEGCVALICWENSFYQSTREGSKRLLNPSIPNHEFRRKAEYDHCRCRSCSRRCSLLLLTINSAGNVMCAAAGGNEDVQPITHKKFSPVSTWPYDPNIPTPPE